MTADDDFFTELYCIKIKETIMRKITKYKKLSLLLAAAVLLLTPLLNAGCGERQTTLRVGMSIPLTGAAAEKGRPMADGKLDAIKYINEELGGVHGIPIEAVWRDTQYDSARSANFVNEYIDRSCLFFTTCSSKEMAASMEIANRNNFPGFTNFSSPILIHPPQHIYAQLPDYGDSFAAFAKYYMENIWEGTGKPKVALHLLNNPTGSGAHDAARALTDELGIEIVAVEEHTATTISEIDSLTRIRTKNPDVIFISSTPQPTSIILKNLRELGMTPGITVGSGHAGFTQALLDLAGTAAEGIYGVFPTASWGDDVPGMAKMTEYCQKYHPESYGNMDYIYCWAEGLIIAEILRLAVEHVGVDNIDTLTPQIVEEHGFKKLNNFDPGGLHGPVSYVPGDNRLATSVRVFQVQAGSMEAVSGWVEAPVIMYEQFPWFGK